MTTCPDCSKSTLDQKKARPGGRCHPCYNLVRTAPGFAPSVDLDPLRRFFSKVEMPAVPSACWRWTGLIDSKGYSRFKVNNSYFAAYRWSYEAATATKIPDGLTIDHLCKVRDCVNPTHLEPVTWLENFRRSDAPAAVNARKTHCKNRHEFTAENTDTINGRRQCRACQGLPKRSLAEVAR